MSKKSPQLRFEGFTDDWEERKWIDTVDMSTNMVNPKTGDYDDLLHIGPGNIESFTGRILDNVNTVKNDNLISGKFHFNPNDIIYGKINPQLAKYVHVDFEGLASADAYVLNSKNGVNQGFLFVELQTSGFYKYSVSVSMRTGMPKINRDELNQFSYLAPKNIEEQQRIGSFFKQLDDNIVLHQRKLDLLKEQKKGYLQKMFPKNGAKVPELRFAGFADDWEDRELEQQRIGSFFKQLDDNIVLHQRKLDLLKEQKKGYLQKMFPKNGAKVPELRFAGFADDWEDRELGKEFKKVSERNDGSFGRDHWISVAKMYFQSPEKVQSNNIDTRTYVMREGDIAFEGHPNSEFKFGRFVANDIGAGVVSELFPIYKHQHEYDNNYWKNAIQIERIMAPIFAKSITSSGNSSNKLDTKHFLRQKILIPQINEQKKMGSFFKQLDNTIALHQRKLDLLKEQKKGYLQKMFPKNGAKVPELRFAGFADDWEERKFLRGLLTIGKSVSWGSMLNIVVVHSHNRMGIRSGMMAKVLCLSYKLLT